MAFTADGNSSASVDEDGKLLVWDVLNGVLRERLDAHAGSTEGLAITPDGRTAVTSGIDGRGRPAGTLPATAAGADPSRSASGSSPTMSPRAASPSARTTGRSQRRRATARST